MNEQAATFLGPRGPPTVTGLSPSTESRCSERLDKLWVVRQTRSLALEAQTQNTERNRLRRLQETGCVNLFPPLSGLMHIHEENNSRLEIMIHAGSARHSEQYYLGVTNEFLI